MTVFEAILAYVVAWWMVFFMTLPFGVRPPAQLERGHADGAPEQPHLWIKAAVTTVIAGLLVWAFNWLVESGLISLRP